MRARVCGLSSTMTVLFLVLVTNNLLRKEKVRTVCDQRSQRYRYDKRPRWTLIYQDTKCTVESCFIRLHFKSVFNQLVYLFMYFYVLFLLQKVKGKVTVWPWLLKLSKQIGINLWMTLLWNFPLLLNLFLKHSGCDSITGIYPVLFSFWGKVAACVWTCWHSAPLKVFYELTEHFLNVCQKGKAVVCLFSCDCV